MNMVSQAQINLVLLVKAVAFLFFLFDIIFDVRDHILDAAMYETFELVHLLFEGFAVVAIGAGIWLTFQYQSVLKEQANSAEQNLYYLRNDFDSLLRKKFESWGFTDAEREIAILVLRGFTNAQIAELRETKVGTVKVQIHKLIQKTNSASRTDFMAVFMDEFLDFAAESQ